MTEQGLEDIEKWQALLKEVVERHDGSGLEETRHIDQIDLRLVVSVVHYTVLCIKLCEKCCFFAPMQARTKENDYLEKYSYAI